MKRSTRTRSPADPKTRSSKNSLSACSASAGSWATTTPLPAARPSALKTTGRPKDLSARSASARVVTISASAVGIEYFFMNVFENAFEPSSSAASRFGPKARRPRCCELVHEAERERQLRPHDREVDLHRLGEVGQLDDVVDGDRDAGRELRDARVAGRAEDVRDARRLRELPDECVLAPARTDHEESHATDGILPRRVLTRPAGAPYSGPSFFDRVSSRAAEGRALRCRGNRSGAPRGAPDAGAKSRSGAMRPPEKDEIEAESAGVPRPFVLEGAFS